MLSPCLSFLGCPGDPSQCARRRHIRDHCTFLYRVYIIRLRISEGGGELAYWCRRRRHVHRFLRLSSGQWNSTAVQVVIHACQPGRGDRRRPGRNVRGVRHPAGLDQAHFARHHGRDQRAHPAQGRQGRADHNPRDSAICSRSVARRVRICTTCKKTIPRPWCRDSVVSRSPSACQRTAARPPRFTTMPRMRRSMRRSARVRRFARYACFSRISTATMKKQIGALLRERHPTMPVSLSSEIQPEFREYERFTTTVLNAYLQPVMDDYLGYLSEKLGHDIPGANLGIYPVIGRSDVDRPRAPLPRTHRAIRTGGRRGRRRPHEPPGRATQRDHARHGRDQCGRCADPRIRDRPKLRTRGGRLPRQVADGRHQHGRCRRRIDRLVRPRRAAQGGTGQRRRRPRTGLLRAGRQRNRRSPTPISCSAAFPRPGWSAAAWRSTGTRRFASSSPSPSGLASPPSAPRTASSASWSPTWSRAIRAVSVERGHDPRDYALMPFGGAGPLHAVDVARSLGMREVIVPAAPGILCAQGADRLGSQRGFRAPGAGPAGRRRVGASGRRPCRPGRRCPSAGSKWRTSRRTRGALRSPSTSAMSGRISSSPSRSRGPLSPIRRRSRNVSSSRSMTSTTGSITPTIRSS